MLALWLTLGWAVAARGQSASPLEVEWRAPASCPQLSDFTAALSARLDASAGEGSRVVGVVECGDPDGCRLELRLSGRVTGERRLEHSNCNDIADWAAVLTAIALDTTGTPPEEERPPPPETPDELPPDDPAPKAPWEIELSPRALLDVGTLPSAQSGGGLALRAGRGLWKLGVAASAFGPVSLALDDPAARLRFTAWDLALEAASEWQVGRARLGPSVGLGATGLRGRSRSVAVPAAETRWMLAPRVGLGAALSLRGRWSLRADAQALWLRPRTRWSADGFARQHTVAVLVGRFALGLSIRL